MKIPNLWKNNLRFLKIYWNNFENKELFINFVKYRRVEHGSLRGSSVFKWLLPSNTDNLGVSGSSPLPATKTFDYGKNKKKSRKNCGKSFEK